jgi:hypothetical protein
MKVEMQISSYSILPPRIDGPMNRAKKKVVLTQPYIYIYISYCHLHICASSFFFFFESHVLPASTHQQTEASKMYAGAIQRLQGTKRALHLTLQEGSRDEPSPVDTATCKHTWIWSSDLHNWIHQTWKKTCHKYILSDDTHKDVQRNIIVSSAFIEYLDHVVEQFINFSNHETPCFAWKVSESSVKLCKLWSYKSLRIPAATRGVSSSCVYGEVNRPQRHKTWQTMDVFGSLHAIGPGWVE